MTDVLALLIILPLVTTAACLVLPDVAREWLTVLTGIASFGLVLSLVHSVTQNPVQVGFLRVDAVSVVFLLGTSFLYAVTAIYSVGYVRGEKAELGQRYGRYHQLFFIGINLFAWAMLFAPAASGLAMVWVGVEVTTIVSALLVAIDNTEAAAEAAWKYVLIASSGLGIALLATVVMYYAGSQVLGDSYDLGLEPLLLHAHQLPATPVRLAFVLAVVGFGTKVGLFPVHTWLPDAHAEAPTPVSALLSGSLLAVSFYAILRFYQVAEVTVGVTFPRTTLLVFGILTLLLAALYLLEQGNLKRLLAYSSIEHMGVLAIGMGFGTPIAVTGVLLHVLAHAAGKGNAFMGAGVMVRAFDTKSIAGIRGGLKSLPWSGPLFLISIFALSAMPPFGIFRSEFMIVMGGFESHAVIAAVLVVLVGIAFAGLTLVTTRMLSEDPSGGQHGGDQHDDAVVSEPSVWMVVPMVAGVVVLIILGVYPPPDLMTLLHQGAADLGVGLHGK